MGKKSPRKGSSISTNSISTNSISTNIEKVAQSLFEEGAERASFLEAIAQGERAVTAVVRLRGEIQSKIQGEIAQVGNSATQRAAWLPDWISVAAPEERPGRSEQHQNGEIYCLDLSSTFACATLSQLAQPTGILLDMCAAPGGKGIVGARYLSPQIVIGNEVIRKRTLQLISNYKRCRMDPALVTSCDPESLAQRIPHRADVVIVDAPCSGQSLLLKGLAAPGAFHHATISMNEGRQRRILANSAKTVAPGGALLYSTCTFSREENENNIEWFLKTFPEFHAVTVDVLAPYRSRYSSQACYRLFPHEGHGAGAFCALLQREGSRSSLEICIDEITDTLRPTWRSPTVFALRPAPIKRQEAEHSRKAQRGKWKGRDDKGSRRFKRFTADDQE